MFIGPTSFILNTFINDMSIFFNEYLRMSLYTDPFGQSAWPQNWTIFYWAWWVTACPYTAIFIAKISRGRTIREVAIGGFLWGTLGDFVAFAVLGGSTMYAQVFQGMDLTSIMNTAGNSAAVATLISSFPFATVLVPLFIASMFIFSSTTYDSCTYVMANIAFKSSSVTDEAPRWQRLLWAALVAIAASTLLYLGGLKPLQSFSIITAIPMGVISVAICVLFMRDIKEDYKAVFGESHETYLSLDKKNSASAT
jgi:BCCT family betaine/carnitine transporter